MWVDTLLTNGENLVKITLMIMPMRSRIVRNDTQFNALSNGRLRRIVGDRILTDCDQFATFIFGVGRSSAIRHGDNGTASIVQFNLFEWKHERLANKY